MMGPEDIGERRQVNHTPTIALTVAAVLLLIVGALSYRDFVRSSLEKEFAEKERQLLIRQGYVAPEYSVQPNNQASVGALPNGPVPTGQVPYPNQQGAYPQTYQPSQLSPQAPQNYNPNAVANQANNMGVETTLPRPADPELDSIRSSLNQAREQSRRTEEQYNQLAGTVDSRIQSAANEPITSELPDFLREAVTNPPGGNPSVEEELAMMKRKVNSAPALAQVTGYDKDWGIVTFNAGSGQGVEKGKRFAVRRGGEILGWVKVDEVMENESIAILLTKNRDIDTAEKPSVGDDLINFEMF